jgi:hypothetical protein
MTRLSERGNQGEGQISEELVTRMYQFRSELWSADPRDYPTLLQREGLPKGLSRRKEILIAWLQRHIPNQRSVEEHRQAIYQTVTKLRDEMQKLQIKSSFMLIGSAATDRIRHSYSDLDIVTVVPRDQEEIGGLRQFFDENFVVSRALSPREDIEKIVEKETGLARVYAFTSETGIESEFHLIGMQDALRLHCINPGEILRLKPTEPKIERLNGFAGGSIDTLKLPDRVFNYVQREGKYFRGFFPDAMLLGRIIHDPSGVMEKVLRNIWAANVRAFLYHNNLINKNGRYSVDRNAFNFNDFLQTCLSPSEQELPSQVNELMKQRFELSLGTLESKLGIHSY